MKSRRLSLGYFVAVAAAALLSASVEAAAINNKAVVRAIRGTAEISTDSGASWKKARVGQSLTANSVVKTAPESTVDLFLGENGPVVRVTEDTSMGIDKLTLENTGIEKVIETQLDLKNGKILGSVKKMAAASKYEVKTPVGVAGIRGTEYSIDSRGNVQVVSGVVVVVYVTTTGQVLPAVTVTAGQQAAPPPVGGTQPQLTTMSQQQTQILGQQVTVIMVGIEYLPTGEPVDRNQPGPVDGDTGGTQAPGPTDATTQNPDTTTGRCLTADDPHCENAT